VPGYHVVVRDWTDKEHNGARKLAKIIPLTHQRLTASSLCRKGSVPISDKKGLWETGSWKKT